MDAMIGKEIMGNVSWRGRRGRSHNATLLGVLYGVGLGCNGYVERKCYQRCRGRKEKEELRSGMKRPKSTGLVFQCRSQSRGKRRGCNQWKMCISKTSSSDTKAAGGKKGRKRECKSMNVLNRTTLSLEVQVAHILHLNLGSVHKHIEKRY